MHSYGTAGLTGRDARPAGLSADEHQVLGARMVMLDATLQDLKEAAAEAGRRIDRLMVLRRRQLAAARSRQAGK